jgi:hypothetical protein
MAMCRVVLRGHFLEDAVHECLEKQRLLKTVRKLLAVCIRDGVIRRT